MASLVAKSPCEDLVPVECGDVRLDELLPGRITSLMPLKGMEKKASDALKSSHGCAMPAPGRATGKDGARAIWTGLGQAFLVGPVPQAELSGTCTLTDQSDAWAVLRLEGEKAIEVLARLTPLDLRPAHFKRGHTARSLLGHMTASFTRIGANSWMIMVFRSMADTAVHELTDAMQGVAARNEIVSA